MQHQYVDALLKELKMQSTQCKEKEHPSPQCFATSCKAPLHTIYLGGGTPSTLSIPLLTRLIEGIQTQIDTTMVTEWTMECNPDDITPELASWLKNSPTNRVSIGAQTFNNDRLRWLHRRHSSHQVAEAVSLLRQNGIHNISIDLMFGFPNQTLEEWEHDIDTALALHPQHLSAYSLMYEEDTPLYRLLEQNKVEEISDELSLKMFNTLIDKITAAGYEHYEISNFALPGYRSRHNSSYWQQVPYLGLGAAAHSYDGSHRWWNISDIRQYIESINNGILPSESETIDSTTRYNDIITTALRTKEGIHLADITTQQREYLLLQAQPHISAGTLALTDTHIHLTRDGIFISDSIMSDLILLD